MVLACAVNVTAAGDAAVVCIVESLNCNGILNFKLPLSSTLTASAAIVCEPV